MVSTRQSWSIRDVRVYLQKISYYLHQPNGDIVKLTCLFLKGNRDRCVTERVEKVKTWSIM